MFSCLLSHQDENSTIDELNVIEEPKPKPVKKTSKTLKKKQKLVEPVDSVDEDKAVV